MHVNDAQMFDYEDLAAYSPRGLYIKLLSGVFETPDGPGMPTFSSEAFPLFMHEVAHLVQDRSTFRGVIDFLDMWDRVTAVADHVRDCHQRVELPLVNPLTGATRLREDLRWAIETETLASHREPRGAWESEGRYWTYQQYRVEAMQTNLAGRQIQSPKVIVNFMDNGTNETYEHSLGAWEIKEAYSVAVALIHGGPLPEFGRKDFEYLVVERILSYFFGDVQPRQIVALCHWALQDLAPATTFFAIIEHFEEEHALPDEHAIYDFARDEAMARGLQQNWTDILNNINVYERQLGSQSKTLGDLFRWYREHADSLMLLQLDKTRRFPLDTYLCTVNIAANDADRSGRLQTLFEELEVPLIIWPDGSFYSISATREEVGANVLLNLCVLNLMQRLWSSHEASWPCPLHAGCELEMKDGGECLNSPWRKSRFHPTCPYGAAANFMRIGGDVELVAGANI